MSCSQVPKEKPVISSSQSRVGAHSVCRERGGASVGAGGVSCASEVMRTLVTITWLAQGNVGSSLTHPLRGCSGLASAKWAS